MIHIPDSYPRFTYQIRIQDSHTGFVSKLMPSSMNECMLGGAMQGFFSVADEGCPFDALCRVSFRGNMLRSYQGPMRGVLPGPMRSVLSGASAGSPSGADVIALHEIHLARQSSLQVPVGHITVPGGIKLCSPGTFLVANYLIINNGPCQVNFTKPNTATIRYTNSQWLREDATEASVGRVPVPKCR